MRKLKNLRVGIHKMKPLHFNLVLVGCRENCRHERYHESSFPSQSSASEMTYIVSGGALNSLTHPAKLETNVLTNKTNRHRNIHNSINLNN